MSKKDCRTIEIQGKHGPIDLIVPNRKPTREEIVELHKVIAQTIVNTLRAIEKDKKTPK